MSKKLTNTITMTNKGQQFYVIETRAKGNYLAKTVEVSLPALPLAGVQGRTITAHIPSMALSQQHYVGFFLSLSRSSYWSGNGIVQALTPRSFREEGVQDAAKHLAMQVSNAAVAKADADIREAGRANAVALQEAVDHVFQQMVVSSKLVQPDQHIGGFSASRADQDITNPRVLARHLRRSVDADSVYLLAARYVLAKADTREVESLTKAVNTAVENDVRTNGLPPESFAEVEAQAVAELERTLGISVRKAEAA